MSGRTLTIDTAAVFDPLLSPARDKGAWGGRGSGKSHFFAELAIDDALRMPGDAGEGMRMVCAREIQKSLKDSAKFLLESKLQKFGIGEADGFKVYADRIATPKDGLIIFQGLQDHTAESIKSFEGFHRFWAEEAQTITKRSVTLVRPTIRWESERLGLQSEMWWSWNPRYKFDAVDEMLRGPAKPTGAVIVKANWRDNPWFPKVLEQERQDCLEKTPELYDHVWEGGYATVTEGAYFARYVLKAREDGRIGRVPFDPMHTVKVFCDIGGTGAKADAFSMWPMQFIKKEIRTRDYYEARGQDVATHANWLRRKGYTPENTTIVLPHDGDTNDRVIDVSYASAFRGLGYDVEVIPNQGKGAAMNRVKSAQEHFGRVWFDEGTTQAGIDALSHYHERIDEDRNIGLGPEHDWASHGADGFGLGMICYEEPQEMADDAPLERAWVV